MRSNGVTVSRPLAIGGGIAAFAVVVAWMVPPTTPKGGATITATPHAARATPMDVPPAPPADAFFTPPPPPPPLPVDRSADGGGAAASDPSPSQAPDNASFYPPAPRIERDRDIQRYALADPQEEFDRGYRWAERRRVGDPRECRRWAETPREDGCLAFLQDVREQRDDEQEDD